MTTHLGKRVTAVETLTGLRTLDAFHNRPVVLWPDWALASEILGRPVTPAEMQSLERDDGFWDRIDETIRASKEGKMEAAFASLRAEFSAPST